MQYKDFPEKLLAADADILLLQDAIDGANKGISKSNLLAGISNNSASGSSNWQFKNSEYNAVAGNRLIIDTPNQWTLSLPTNPVVGNEIQLLTLNSLLTKRLIINSNTIPINGTVQDWQIYRVNAVHKTTALIYVDPALGWLNISEPILRKYPSNFSLDFAGPTPKYVSVSYRPQFTAIPFTVEALVKIPATLPENGIFGNGLSATVGSWEFRIHNLNQFNLVKFAVIDQTVNLSTPLQLNRTYRLSAVQEANQIKYYVDGLLVGTYINSQPLRTSAQEFYIGKSRDAKSNLVLDDVRFWTVARTQTQINDTKFIGLLGNEIGLFGYWQFDEEASATAIDGTTNNNNGTLVNNPVYKDGI